MLRLIRTSMFATQEKMEKSNKTTMKQAFFMVVECDYRFVYIIIILINRLGDCRAVPVPACGKRRVRNKRLIYCMIRRFIAYAAHGVERDSLFNANADCGLVRAGTTALSSMDTLMESSFFLLLSMIVVHVFKGVFCTAHSLR